MIYLFPIFLFGCAISGVALLGIIEAAEQVKRANATKPQPVQTKLPMMDPQTHD